MSGKETPEPCSDEAYAEGCSCYVPISGSHATDPPEPKVAKDCPLHGWEMDADYAYELKRDREDNP